MPISHPRPGALVLCALPLSLLSVVGCVATPDDAASDAGETANDTASDGGTEADDGGQGDSEADPLDAEALAALGAPTLPDDPLDYQASLPEHFRTETVEGFDNTPVDNPITNTGATLGRVLFYDRRLSRNGEVSCASCHDAEAGFSDPVTQSEGFEGGHTRRNAMPLLNLRYYARGNMFWDERANSLEEQVLMPIQDEVEMGLTLEQLEARVAGTAFYGPLFEQAFGDDDVTSERIALALAQFVRSIVSTQAPWDEGIALVQGDLQQPFPNFSDEENRGKALFFGEHDLSTRGLCGTCHLMNNPLAIAPGGGPPPGTFDNSAVFFMVLPTNNGLFDDVDDGLLEVTGREEDRDVFKSSSLRNIAQTPPYMHDGRFETLEEVVAHYNTGIADHPNLDPALRTAPTGPGPGAGPGEPLKLNLSEADQAALVAFLNTLTDPTIATEERWADPF